MWLSHTEPPGGIRNLQLGKLLEGRGEENGGNYLFIQILILKNGYSQFKQRFDTEWGLLPGRYRQNLGTQRKCTFNFIWFLEYWHGLHFPFILVLTFKKIGVRQQGRNVLFQEGRKRTSTIYAFKKTLEHNLLQLKLYDLSLNTGYKENVYGFQIR